MDEKPNNQPEPTGAWVNPHNAPPYPSTATNPSSSIDMSAPPSYTEATTSPIQYGQDN